VSNENCLSKDFPHLAAQLHPTKNGELTADQIAVLSHKKVWWICSKGHSWQQSIDKRSQSKIICWGCSGLTQPGVPSSSHQTTPHKTVKKKQTGK